MKKYIFGAVLSLGILVSPAFTQASSLTQSQISAIVSLLQSFGADQTTINNVEISLNGGTPTTGGGTRPWCHTFNTDLTIGSSDDDVSALDQVLPASGINRTSKSSTFDENTAADIVSFQAKYGIRQTGYVGPITRAKLNALYGCSPNFPPPPPVQPAPTATFSANGGTNVTANVGDTVNYIWNSTNGTRWSSSYIATGCTNAGSNVNGATWKPADGWERGTIGAQVTDAMRGCTLFISYNVYGAGGNARADVTVNVAAQTTTPSITVLSPNGGETWQTGQTYTITWNNSTGKDVGIEVTGNRGNDNVAMGTYTSSQTSRNFTVPGSWQSGSDFKVTVRASDNSTADSSDAPFSIVAGTTTTPTPLTLTSITPSSGSVGTSIRLDGCGSDSTSGFTLMYTGPRNGTSVIPVETLGAASGCGYMTFTVPSDFQAGAYTLSVKNNQTGAMSTNSEAFTVTAPVVSVPPTASLFADASSVTSGGRFSLYFSSTNATSCTAPSGNWSPGSSIGGSVVVGPITTNTTFTLQCSGPGGTSPLQSVTVVVTPAPTPLTLTNITPASGPVGTSIRLDGCGSDSSSGFTLVYTSPIGKSGSANIPVETLGAASGCGYMTITVPADFPAGVYTLQVKNNQTGAMSTNSEAFTVTAPVAANNPVASVSSTSFAAGASFTSSVSGAAPNAPIRIFSTDPNGVTSEDTPGITDSSGNFSRTYNTNGWMGGNYRGWVTVNGVQSNVVTFNVGTGVTTTTATPVASLSSSSTVQGGMFVVSVSGAPNAAVKIFCRDPNGVSCDDVVPGTTDANGKFSRSYATSGWTLGTYKGWVTVNGVQSNTVGFIITASVSLSGGTSQTASVFNAVNGSVLGNSTSQASATTFTYVWDNNLQIGSLLTRDVKALQTALTRDGEYAGDLTGGFYNQTYAAVKAFQQKHGINATGYVGPLTRAQLNTLFAR